MVSLITQGKATDPEGRPFLRRRWEPWAALVGALAVICLIIWWGAFSQGEAGTGAIACNSPSPAQSTSAPQAAPLGQRMSPSLFQDVEPSALARSKVRVLNANGQRGQATHIASQLSDLGFASAPEAFGNDSVYVNGDLECSGQIRFGVDGRAAAAAVQLVAPCAELIQDQRTDETVDLVLGSLFRDIRPSTDAEEVLRSLKNPAPGSTPAIDPSLLDAARTAKC
ncbi:envelope integrity protein Cei [Nocardia uniformis]|uniref:Envelope integrity protein Cei n=1 Tax=Nocardia uniformis TaxID=53432 RepID=A0A849BX82_9NOCA|nr:envelope integrity protein Cei [Nocardia uniformis]NNH71152.1 envelope integrity protein Cei [Nocardia uniformis]